MEEEKKNAFKEIEPNVTAPENLKKEISSEIDSIRNTSAIVELFVGNFFNAISAALKKDPY